MMFFRAILASFVVLAAPIQGVAHEFWIEPRTYQVETGETMTATLRNGQRFAGVTIPWLDGRQKMFDWVLGDIREPFSGRAGDIPTVTLTPNRPGLLVLAAEMLPQTLTYDEWELFQRFSEHKDLNGVARHQARGLPSEGFSEIFTRHVKALVAVGDGAGSDRKLGLEHEFIALTNPYTDPGPNMRVQLFYLGEPNADQQVEIFDRAEDREVSVTTTRTDAQGIAQFPVLRGHVYLLDAVVLREPSSDVTARTGAVWETLWAAMTFAVPE